MVMATVWMVMVVEDEDDVVDGDVMVTSMTRMRVRTMRPMKKKKDMMIITEFRISEHVSVAESITKASSFS